MASELLPVRDDGEYWRGSMRSQTLLFGEALPAEGGRTGWPARSRTCVAGDIEKMEESTGFSARNERCLVDQNRQWSGPVGVDADSLSMLTDEFHSSMCFSI